MCPSCQAASSIELIATISNNTYDELKDIGPLKVGSVRVDNNLSAVNEVVSLQLDHLPSASSDLSADHERKGNHIAQSVRLMITKNPRLREKYQHPGAEHDRLYEFIYIYRGGDDRCVIGCDNTINSRYSDMLDGKKKSL